MCAGHPTLQEEVSCFSAPDLPFTALQPLHLSLSWSTMPVLGSLVMASSGQDFAQMVSSQCLHTLTRHMKSRFPFISLGPSGQTDRYLIPLSASTGLSSCLHATSQALHPQQANSSIISACLFMAGPLFLFGIDPAQKRPDIRRTHCGVTAF